MGTASLPPTLPLELPSSRDTFQSPHPPQQQPSLALHSFQGRVIPREVRVQNWSGLGLSGLEKGSPPWEEGARGWQSHPD